MAEIEVGGSPDPAIIDDEYENTIRSMKWYLDADGYVRANVERAGKRTNVKLHRIVAELAKIDSSRGISFKDGNKLNCRSANLTRYESKGVRSGDPSRKYIYEHMYKGRKRYQIEVYNKKTKTKEYIGLFDTLEEAKIRRDEVLKQFENAV